MKIGSITFLLFLPILIMGQSNKEVTKDFLQSFADAFNAHDIKAIMSHMTDDCVFEASAGPDFNGEKFTGTNKSKKRLKTYLQHSLTLNGEIRDISFQETEVSQSGFLPELKQMALRSKLQDAIYSLLKMVKYH